MSTYVEKKDLNFSNVAPKKVDYRSYDSIFSQVVLYQTKLIDIENTLDISSYNNLTNNDRNESFDGNYTSRPRFDSSIWRRVLFNSRFENHIA